MGPAKELERRLTSVKPGVMKESFPRYGSTTEKLLDSAITKPRFGIPKIDRQREDLDL